MEDNVAERMRADWNRRAREDAHYFVAFGRRNQGDEEFFATGSDEVRGLEREMRRMVPSAVRSRRALEIGCGPGRLMRPLSRQFGEIHGVDISEEMVRLAREKLAGIAHAHAHHAPGSDLSAFASDSFDFVYSYAVFQHIPSREVVLGYLREARRVLKPGGILRCQVNGLPKTARQYDTWSGVRIGAQEIREFAAEEGLALLALEGAQTQYMRITMRKPGEGGGAAARTGGTRVRRITNANSSEPVAPVRGRFASLSLWVEALPEDCDLNRLEVRVGGLAAFATYMGHPEHDGLQQVNVLLPEGLGTGLQPVELLTGGAAICPKTAVRLVGPAPAVPRVVGLTDGIDLMSGTRLVTGSVKVTLEETQTPGELEAWIGGVALEDREVFCIDPRVPMWEVNYRLPAGVAKGTGEARLRLGRRELGVRVVEVV